MNNALQTQGIRSSKDATHAEQRQTFWRDLWRRLEHWSDRRWQRRALRRLDDHALKDIGLNRADVERECAKPFWKE